MIAGFEEITSGDLFIDGKRVNEVAPADRCRVPAPAVRPVDTTGAGDIFGGSAVAKLLALDTPPAELEPGALEGIARFAVTAASLSTLRPGGISSIPTEAEVLAALEE